MSWPHPVAAARMTTAPAIEKNLRVIICLLLKTGYTRLEATFVPGDRRLRLGMPPDLPVGPSNLRAVPAHLLQERGGVTVWWSNIKREGEWILPRIFRVFTFMGNVELDLTSARIVDGISEIEIRCIMANVEISVPPDIRVLSDGDGIMGNFEVIRVGECPPPRRPRRRKAQARACREFP